MERYREASIVEIANLIEKEAYSDLYFQTQNGSLARADEESWKLSDFNFYKWFIREVVE